MSPETQKSLPFLKPVSSKNIEKRRLNRAATGGQTKDFCGTLMGPPRRARKSKTQKALAATRSGALDATPDV
jgi:hypothetical protein